MEVELFGRIDVARQKTCTGERPMKCCNTATISAVTLGDRTPHLTEAPKSLELINMRTTTTTTTTNKKPVRDFEYDLHTTLFFS
jgi:hypothetical protein